MTQYTQIELLTLHGPVFRRVSTAPPRPATDDEIPVIDLSTINGDFEARKKIASHFKAASENTGFFYIKNHGIDEELIERALESARVFFDQTDEQKNEAHDRYRAVGTTQINKKESKDRKETFFLEYDPRNDPATNKPATLQVLGQDNSLQRDHEVPWQGTGHIPGFQETTIEFWQRRLTLARKMIRIFALALDMPEDYFDEVTTQPGSDGLYIHYPGSPETVPENADMDVGIGSHTDIQCITLLWQDMSGGLQVLSASDEWLDARPIAGTLVVNIGDFLQRLSNNRFKSTVHRVYNRQTRSRYSMPFFFGFNADSVCQVVPSCIDEDHPALYEPISCGKWHRDRMALAQGKLLLDDYERKAA